MAGFNGLGINGVQQAVSQGINQPQFVNERATSPYGGQGSAYTIDVLNSLQPLGVNPNQYPNMQPPPAAAPAQPSQNIPPGFNPYANPFAGQVTGGPRGDRGFNDQSLAQKMAYDSPQAVANRIGMANGTIPTWDSKWRAMLGVGPRIGTMTPTGVWDGGGIGQNPFQGGQGGFQSPLNSFMNRLQGGGAPMQQMMNNSFHPAYQNPPAYSPPPPPPPVQSALPPAFMAHAVGGAPFQPPAPAYAPPPPPPAYSPPAVNNLGMPRPLSVPVAANQQNLFGGHYQTPGRSSGGNR